MLTLQSGESSLVLAPEIGGAVVGWAKGTVPLFRRPHPDAIMLGNVRGLSCFPLVPFSNRIAYGRFRWHGVEYQLDRNFGDHPHTIHGVGWQSVWEVAEVASASAVLRLRHDPSGAAARRWPFAFAAEQRIELGADGLRIELSVQNLHTAAAPTGLGLHPHFPLVGGATLQFDATAVWRNGADSLPSTQVAIPSEWDHAEGKRIGTAALDNCFTGWDGHAAISPARLTIEADALFRFLIVYTPPGRGYFCVEPVSHMPDAINRMDTVPDHGLRVLAPGETLTGAVWFRLS